MSSSRSSESRRVTGALIPFIPDEEFRAPTLAAEVASQIKATPREIASVLQHMRHRGWLSSKHVLMQRAAGGKVRVVVYCKTARFGRAH